MLGWPRVTSYLLQNISRRADSNTPRALGSERKRRWSAARLMELSLSARGTSCPWRIKYTPPGPSEQPSGRVERCRGEPRRPRQRPRWPTGQSARRGAKPRGWRLRAVSRRRWTVCAFGPPKRRAGPPIGIIHRASPSWVPVADTSCQLRRLHRHPRLVRQRRRRRRRTSCGATSCDPPQMMLTPTRKTARRSARMLIRTRAHCSSRVQVPLRR